MNNRPITEDDLQGHVDNRLNAARQAEVTEYLRQHPDEAQRIDSYGKQRDSLRAAFSAVAEEPVPAELNLARMLEARQSYHFPVWRSAVAAGIFLCIGVAGGWFLHNLFPPSTNSIIALADEAAYTYQVFAADKGRPVEIKAADEAALIKWVSNRLRHTVSIPDLSASGFAFLGGRVIATANGPAGMFMYDNGNGTRLVMLTRPMAGQKDSPVSPRSTSPVQAVTWSKEGVGYSLAGPVPPDVLNPLADEVRKQIERNI
jgi:anti-sigma factor RsiW